MPIVSSSVGIQTELISVPVSYTDPAVSTGDAFMLATLNPGQLILDVWLTVTVTFQHNAGPVVATGNIFAGIDVVNSGVQLFNNSFSMNLDGNIESGFAWLPGAPTPGTGARSLSGEAIAAGASKRVPITVIDALQVAFFSDGIAGIDQGAGTFYLFVATLLK